MKNLLNLFKPVSVKTTAEVIEEIHHAFNNEGDRLLAEATAHLSTLVVADKDKANKLAALGFTSTKEVKQKAEVEAQIEVQTQIATAIREAKEDFPLYRFITEESAERIAKKYSLVLGEVSRYKGFVPKKNVDEIERFFTNHPEEEHRYTVTYIYSSWSVHESEITKYHYERGKAGEIKSYADKTFYNKEKTKLMICAPLSDMDTKGMKLNGWKLEREIPDPIVMIPKTYNEVKGFIIVTAWGDEASDPEVVNSTVLN